MSTRLIALGLLSLAPLSWSQEPPPPPAPAPVATTAPAIDFRTALSPYGTWTTLAPCGEVWIPTGMPAGWRPYTTGHWVYADAAGWTWVADEPWGWAPFHYGRWTLDPALGWVWIPGNVWGPAWVAWREGDGVTGWAPLPPAVGWRAGIGLDLGGVDLVVAIGEPWWSFVPVGGLASPRVSTVLIEQARTRAIVHQTTIVRENIVIENGRPVNRPVKVEVVEKAGGAPVQHVVLREVDHEHGAAAGANEVAVHRPETRAEPRREPAPHAPVVGNAHHEEPAPRANHHPHPEGKPRQKPEHPRLR